MAERDMERAEVAKATGHVGEMEQEIGLLRDEQEQVSSLTGGSVITLLLIVKCFGDKSCLVINNA